MRGFVVLGAFVLTLAPLSVRAQAAVSASVRTSDGARWVNVGLADDGTSLEGCVAATRSCRRTQRVTLTPAEVAELATRLSAVATMGLCEPSSFAAGDPEFHLVARTFTGDGHVPAAWALSPSHGGSHEGWDEPCRADARLAQFLAATFTRTAT